MFQITVSLSRSRWVFSRGAKRSEKETARSVSKASVAPEKSGQASSTTQPRRSNTLRCFSSTAVTRGSMGSPPRSLLQAILVFLEGAGKGGRKDLSRFRDRGRRARVGARHRRKQERGVLHGARDRPQHRLRVPGVGRRVGGHAARRRAEAHHVAVVARIAQAGGEVRAVGERQHAAGDRDGRAAGGAAGGLARVVGVARGAEHLVEGVAAGAEFRRVGLAERDRARRLEALDDQRVLRRHVVRVDQRPERGADPLGRHQVLVGDRQAGQRLGLVRLGVPVEFSRRGKRGFGQERHDRVDLGVHALDLRDEGLHHLGGRELAAADQPGQLFCGCEADVGHSRHDIVLLLHIASLDLHRDRFADEIREHRQRARFLFLEQVAAPAARRARGTRAR